MIKLKINELSEGQWNDFVGENNGDFLQSWQWGKLQEKENKKVFRINIISEKNELIGVFHCFQKKIKIIGNYLYIPRGPVFKKDIIMDPNVIINFIKNIADGPVFCIWESLTPLSFGNVFNNIDNIQPPQTLILNLEKNEEVLFKDLNYSRRQGINFAKKNGVEVVSGSSNELFDIFWNLLCDTGKRQKFGYFSKAHYLNIKNNFKTKIYVSKQNNQYHASAQVIFWYKSAYYLHAGSANINKKLRASDLLLWEIILDCKKEGMEKLDLWGIDKKKWPGVTEFKKSFGGDEFIYPPAKLIVFKKIKYLLYKMLSFLINLVRK
jgi:lipid II:glycine glycyltransferase (peptidoglycan interpeptide bridge formation enzyme)